MHSVNYISCNIIENLINKVLDVKPLLPFIITEYANRVTNSTQFRSIKVLRYPMQNISFEELTKTIWNISIVGPQ